MRRLHHLLSRFLPLALLLGITQCMQPEKTKLPLQRFTYQQAMMGTHFLITLYAPEKSKADAAAKAAYLYASNVNQACSDYDVTSELMQLNAYPPQKIVHVSPLLYDVLAKARHIAQKTDGAYDPTLGHHSYNWRMARKKHILPSQEKIAHAIAHSGWNNYQLDTPNQGIFKLQPDMRFDLGGIAKGYAADGMLRILREHNIYAASVTAGGEVRLGDRPPGKDGWDVSLKTLDENNQLAPKILTLSNCAVSTSGDLHQSITIDGKRYSHIVDPTTGLGLTTRVSATVIADSATLSDALATALCVNPQIDYRRAQTLVILSDSEGKLTAIPNQKWIDNQ